jgi:tetratricopeptide (TPR) repeat protein
VPIRHLVVRAFALVCCSATYLAAIHPVAAQNTADRDRARDSARAIARTAMEAAQTGDPAAQWHARVTANPNDRPARLGLAIVELYGGSIPAGDSALQTLLAATDDPVATYAAVYHGIALVRIGRWSAALHALDSATTRARALHDSSAEGDALLAMVPIENRLRIPTAPSDLARADLIIPAGDVVRHARSTCLHGTMLDPSKASAALDSVRAGAAAAHQAGNARVEADCEFAGALNLGGRGISDSALAALTVVIDRASRIHDGVLRSAALQWRGYVKLTLGRYGDAEDDLTQSVAQARLVGNLNSVGWSELNLSVAALHIGDVAAARRWAARSRAVLTATGDSAGLGILRRGDGELALAAGDTAAARAGYLEALHAAERHARLVDMSSAHLGLADLDARTGQWDLATAELDSAERLSAATDAAWTHLMPWHFGRMAFCRGQWSLALSDFRAAESTLDSNQHLFRYQMDEAMSEAWLHVGDTSRAIAELTRANVAIDRWRASLDDEAMRVLAFQAGLPNRCAIRSPAAVIAAAVRAGRVTTAFALAERGRARELGDQLRRADVLRAANATAPRARREAGIVTLSRLQGSIPDDSTAILEYVVGRASASTTAFLVTRRRANAMLLPPMDSLTDAVDRLDALIEQDAPIDAPARTLGAGLLGRVSRALPSAIVRLVIVPDGALYRVPFAALRLPDGHAVVERYAIAIAPSATVIATLWHRHSRPGGARVLAFGDPVLPHEAIAAPDAIRGSDEADTIIADTIADDRDAAGALERAGQLPRVPWTADEARVIGAFGTGSVVRLREDASAAYLVRSPLDAFAIVHFATHAVVDDASPERSALALAPGDGYSGFVSPGDLASLRLQADLVALSACRTARGAIVAGEGVRGFAAPLLAAGARSVLATQWGLNDRGAVPIVYAIYRGIAANLPIAEAVRQAELAALRRGAPVRAWAAFTVTGDPLVRIPLRLPPPDRVPAWLTAGAPAS